MRLNKNTSLIKNKNVIMSISTSTCNCAFVVIHMCLSVPQICSFEHQDLNERQLSQGYQKRGPHDIS